MKSNKGLYSFKSKFEEEVYSQLVTFFKERPVFYEGSSNLIHYYTKPTKHRYTCDFCLPNGIFIEVKGRFIAKDRQKHLLIREFNPSFDVRFVFHNANTKILKKSKTTYSDWCIVHGFKWASEKVPLEWLQEERRLI